MLINVKRNIVYAKKLQTGILYFTILLLVLQHLHVRYIRIDNEET